MQIYLPDLKFFSSALSGKYAAAPDYFEVASKAILEMHRQQPKLVWDGDMLRQGMIVRHLVLPGSIDNSLGVLDWFSETFPHGDVWLSLMSQYVPMGRAKDMPPFDRMVTEDEYDAVLSYLDLLGIENGYTQDFSAANTSYIPDFNLEGL